MLTTQITHSNWTALQLSTIYRIGLAMCFLAVHAINYQFINILNEKDYVSIATGYLFLGLFTFWLALRKKIPLDIQAHLGLILDVFAILTLMITCGGMISGLGMLLLISTAAHTLLTSPQKAISATILSIACLIGAHYYTLWQYPFSMSLYHHTAVLCAALLSTTLFISTLAKNIRLKQQQLALEKEKNRQNYLLAQHIIATMETGILVLTPAGEIIFTNEAAHKLLDMPVDVHTVAGLSQWHSMLFKAIQNKQEHEKMVGQLCFYFFCLPATENWWIVHIKDLKKEHLRVQQLKLASLGHLSANIAHELRNPLSAISQAAQLLDEQELNNEPAHLVNIINKHTTRINQIIENVLSLSRKQHTKTENINLTRWATTFIEQYFSTQDNIQFHMPDKAIYIHFDSSQLSQVLLNICENSLREVQNTPNGHVSISISDENQQTSICIQDNGKGIPEDIAEHIFEPFYTSHTSGTGLGLTIAKELCALNQADLEYSSNANGTTFIIKTKQELPCRNLS